MNGAQLILAVQLYRIAENRRKRPEDTDPNVVRYASCFIAMQMGKRLLADLALADVGGISHLNFTDASDLTIAHGVQYYSDASQDIQLALKDLYGGQDISLQQLSATFRRGDLIERLDRIDVAQGGG